MADPAWVAYRAYDPELDRKVALKLVRQRPSAVGDADGRARMLREAQAIARLSHLNVVAIHDVGTAGDVVFIAMELVEGDTLAARLGARDLRGQARQGSPGRRRRAGRRRRVHVPPRRRRGLAGRSRARARDPQARRGRAASTCRRAEIDAWLAAHP